MKLLWQAAQIPLLLIAACVAAGLYGIAHDQVTYTISPDYFHHLKFQQFHIAEQFHNRVGASKVGWAATNWMGLVVGFPLLVVGFLLLKLDRYGKAVCVAFGLAMLTAAGVGLLACVAVLPISMEGLAPEFQYPAGVTDRESFLEVGMIHNASYLGGGLGFFLALGYLVRLRWGKPVNRTKVSPQMDQSA